MKTVLHPTFAFTASESETVNAFLTICESIEKELINDSSEELRQYLQNSIDLNWIDFFRAVQLLVYFIDNECDETD